MSDRAGVRLGAGRRFTRWISPGPRAGNRTGASARPHRPDRPGDRRKRSAFAAPASAAGTLRNDEGPPDGGHYRIYDLDMRFVGFLDAPYLTNIPHPMVFPVPLPGRRTLYRMVTFDGTHYHEDVLGYGTHGDFYVMAARPIVRGWEFAPRRPPFAK
jgi:hypothetical protein